MKEGYRLREPIKADSSGFNGLNSRFNSSLRVVDFDCHVFGE